MRNLLFIAVSSLALAACGADGQTDQAETDTSTSSAQSASDPGYETYSADNQADTMASNDDRYQNEAGNDGASDQANSSEPADTEKRPVMQAQVVLDRMGWGPGVIDGKMGMSTENALLGFQEANDLETTGKLDEKTKQALADWEKIPATRVVTIPASWSDLEFTDMPEDTAAKAKLEKMGYKSLDEKLAERFHTTVEVLKQLNPGGKPAGVKNGSGTDPKPTETPDVERSEKEAAAFFKAGQQIRVPNIGADAIKAGSIGDQGWQQTLASLGVGSDQPQVDRIVVSKSNDTLRAYQGDKLVALFTVSSGSSEFPLPIGEWDILGKAYNPPYSYDPKVLGQGEGETYSLPPGPNGPVGVVWIDLSKEHYGIHGTPDPETIGRAQSSGCVRLTNWDAARLAQMVSQSTQVIFEA